ncbi:HesA/MoeB/ThiF family protein [Natronoflexus pectinivorans]|uniref:Molybdopterin/thiamine biosynthesis adenylyltransferase n=1 Tax=Natronoflexus pectinivorans TaxID=682526 RepID=A0A4R2GJF8_9BACT|nr:HesA/MoeB/ThiF family protein [Natronoflexus pectinivorans]TCO07480.1 molybdopterin/thiamine biosynthesis adenylyltransferase [Natronoflexus pectinivorans]
MRYARHLLLDNFDESHQERLAKSSVLVVGAGGLGSALLLYLSAAGVGHIGVLDFDVISTSNLNRQILYHPGLVGELKSEEAAKRVKEINPDCKVTCFNRKVTTENAADTIRGFDVVADATDNFQVRYAVDDACRKLNVPLVYGTAEQWGGQLSVFHFNGAKGYSDLYPEAPEVKKTPPGVMGPMPGFIGTRQALEIIKIITGQGEVLAGKLMVFDVLNNQNLVFDI